jgi:hypothetical protein
MRTALEILAGRTGHIAVARLSRSKSTELVRASRTEAKSND